MPGNWVEFSLGLIYADRARHVSRVDLQRALCGARSDDSIFQIWITLTFAVLIATYVAERRFDPALYGLVSGLYAFASGILLLRFASAAYQGFHYKNLLHRGGFEPWPVPNVVGLIIGIGTFVFLLSGTLGTLWFVRNASRRGSRPR
jgi:hypothetical protein